MLGRDDVSSRKCLPITSLRVQPNVSSVAGFTSVTSPSWSTITTQSSAARRMASLRPSLVASARSDRLRAVTSTISAITPTSSPCAVADRAGRDVDVDQRAVAVAATEVEVAQHFAGRLDALEVADEEILLAVGNDRADAADHLLGAPAEHLRRAGVPRAHAPVEVEVDDRNRRGLDQRALVLVRLLDQLELRCLLERGHRLVRERAQDAQALGLGQQAVLRIVRPDVADAPPRRSKSGTKSQWLLQACGPRPFSCDR